jgi:uncharacterized protein YukE
MSDGPQYFWDLLSEVRVARDEAIGEICDACDRIVDMLNGALGSFGAFIDGILPGENEVEMAVKKWNEEIVPKVNELIGSIRSELSDALDELAGSPVDLKDYAEGFANAKADLYKKASIAQDIVTLGKSWSGDAFDAYGVVAEEQHEALSALAKSLESGGLNCIAAANQILTLWKTLLREFASYNSDLLGLLASATNAANVISFEVPAIFETGAKIWENVWDLSDLLMEFMINQATNDMFNWLTLSNGSDGLPLNSWPKITADSGGTMGDSGSWDPKVS